MERVMALTVLSGLAVASAHADAGGKLIVHEWGTFTSFAGPDGVPLDFRPLLESDLPNFVFDRARQAGATNPEAVASQKGQIRATQRMETPITYFYTEREREIDVRVHFPEGLLTEFYPPVSQQGPAYAAAQPEPLKDSFLHWASVRLSPGSAAAFPASETDAHYALARRSDSTPLRVSAAHGEHFEKFLFYRGVGNFSLPVSLQAAGGDRFVVESRLGEPGMSAFMVDVAGGRLRFVPISCLVNDREARLPDQPSRPEALSAAMVNALVGANLYSKEAEAMVDTWRDSWFGEEGTRLLYLLGASTTNRILPLSITPAPDEVVRVMVGRLEIMTPEREARLEESVRRLAGSPAGTLPPAEWAEWGRFAEPALRKLAGAGRDEVLRSTATRLLDHMR